ncbi:hypothetical protein F4859DRAFT_487400 [Xylaria cf. heliscus]|nr:hypothetical protein F4859DRAFT_487400 [Xylaria cf. heliscus]
MNTNIEPTRYPQLPTEVYVHIVEFITDPYDLPHVWLNFRRVSRNFKAITELVFARKHLPHTIIDFPAPTHETYTLSLQFEKLAGDDDERAVFSCNRQDDPESAEVSPSDNDDEEYTLSDISVMWRRRFYKHSRPPPETAVSIPPHILSVRCIINETALPGLEVNWERPTISVLWKEMLTALFGEEDYLHRVVDEESLEKCFPGGGNKFSELYKRGKAGDDAAMREIPDIFVFSSCGHRREAATDGARDAFPTMVRDGY